MKALHGPFRLVATASALITLGLAPSAYATSSDNPPLLELSNAAAAPAQQEIGKTVDFSATLTVQTAGGDPTDAVTLVHTLPAGNVGSVTVVSGDGDGRCVPAGAVVTCTYPAATMKGGTVKTPVIRATLTSGAAGSAVTDVISAATKGGIVIPNTVNAVVTVRSAPLATPTITAPTGTVATGKPVFGGDKGVKGASLKVYIAKNPAKPDPSTDPVNCTVDALATAGAWTCENGSLLANGDYSVYAVQASSSTNTSAPSSVQRFTVAVAPSAKLALTDATGKAGSTVTTTLTLTNTGSPLAPVIKDPVVAVTLPQGVSFTSDTMGKCTAASGGATCTFTGSAVPPEIKNTLTDELTLEVAEGAESGDLTATLTTPVIKPAPSASAKFTLLDGLIVTAKPVPTVVPGAPVTYSVTALNHGDPADATLTGILPVNLSEVKAVGCSVAGSSVSCPLGSLATDKPKELLITGVLQPDTTGTVEATFAATPGDSSVEVVSAVKPRADLAITGHGSKLRAKKPAVFTYTIRNHGPSSATLAHARGTMSRHLHVRKVSGRGCRKAGSGFTCAWPSLQPGATATVRVTVHVKKGRHAVATATIGSATPDPVKSNNTKRIKARIHKR